MDEEIQGDRHKEEPEQHGRRQRGWGPLHDTSIDDDTEDTVTPSPDLLGASRISIDPEITETKFLPLSIMRAEEGPYV